MDMNFMFFHSRNYLLYREYVMKEEWRIADPALEIDIICNIFKCTEKKAIELCNSIAGVDFAYYANGRALKYLIKQLINKFKSKNYNTALSYELFYKFFESIYNQSYIPLSLLNINYILCEILESDKYINGLIPENFMNVFFDKSTINNKSNNDILLLFRAIMLAPRIEISHDSYDLILDTLFNKSDADFLEVVFKVLKDNIEVYPESLRDDLNYFINQFSNLYKTADSVFALNEKIIEILDKNDLSVDKIEGLPPMEHPILIDSKYLGLCSLLFSEAFISGKLTRNILSTMIDKLKYEPFICELFLDIVTSKAFVENKISNSLLEKILNSKYLECITIILESEYYYNGTITEEDINMLLDDNYKIILFIVELLLTDEELDKSDHRLMQGKDGNYYTLYNNMDLVIELIKFEKKLGLCDELEQAMDLYPVINPEPTSITIDEIDGIPITYEVENEPFILRFYEAEPVSRIRYYLKDWLCQPNGINELTQKLQSGKKRELKKEAPVQ